MSLSPETPEEPSGHSSGESAPNHDTGDSEPSGALPKTPQDHSPSLPPELAERVKAFTAQQFVKCSDDLPDQLASFLDSGSFRWWSMMIGTHREAPFQKQGKELHQVLRELAQESYALGDLLKSQIEQGNLSQVAKHVVQDLGPLAEQMVDFVEKTRQLKSEVSKKWITKKMFVSMDGVERDHQRDLVGKVGRLLTQTARFAPRTDVLQSVDLNRATLVAFTSARGIPFDIVLAENNPATEMKQQDLFFVLQSVHQALSDTVNLVNKDAKQELYRDGQIFKIPSDEFAFSETRQIARHVLLEHHKPSVVVEEDGSVTMQYEFTPFLAGRWVEARERLESALSDARAVMKLHGGDLEISVEECEICVSSRFKAEAYEDEEYQQMSQARYQHLREPIIVNDYVQNRHLTLVNEISLGDEKPPARCVFDVRGIVLEDLLSYNQVRAAAEEAAQITKLFPELNRVRLAPWGRGGEMEDSFGQGNLQLSFSRCDPDNPEGRGRRTDAELRELRRKYVEEPFDWEISARQVDANVNRFMDEQEESSERNKLARCTMGFGPGLLSNPEVVELVERIGGKARILQFPLDHDQLGRTEREKYQAAATNLLVEIDKMLDAVQEQVGDSKLFLQVSCYTAMRVADVGKSDKAWNIELYNETGEQIAAGDYFAREKTLRYKVFDTEEIEEAATRLKDFFQQLRDDPGSPYAQLEAKLQEVGVELPEKVIFALIDLANGRSEHPYVPAGDPELSFHQFLHKATTVIQREGDRIKIRHIEGKELAQGQCYGVVTQVTGNDPEEVVDFEMARELYEQQYPYFEPSERFLSEYGITD